MTRTWARLLAILIGTAVAGGASPAGLFRPAAGPVSAVSQRQHPNRRGRVERLEDSSCRLAFTALEEERDAIEALAGSPASTRHPLYGQERR